MTSGLSSMLSAQSAGSVDQAEFRITPSEVTFRDVEIGVVYRAEIVVINTSKHSQRVRFPALTNTNAFSLVECKNCRYAVCCR